MEKKKYSFLLKFKLGKNKNTIEKLKSKCKNLYLVFLYTVKPV